MASPMLLVLMAASLPAPAVERAIELGGGPALRAVEVFRSPGVWEGRIVDDPSFAGGWVAVIDTNAGPVTVVHGPDGSAMQSIPLGDGTFRVVESDGPLMGCGGAVEPPARVAPPAAHAAMPCDDGSQIDILVKWTPSAEAAAGGATAIRAIAEASVAMSNHVYFASGVNIRMRAVGYGISEAYSGDAGSTVLDDLQKVGDGILDAVHGERDAVGADVVALLTAAHPSYCGIGYLVGQPYPDYGFSVTVWSCALGGLTFVHEVGHNQGCCHAPGDGGGCTTGGVFPYSVGYRFTATNSVQYRTVMAYSPGTRIPRLSNPNVSFLGAPTGLATADNARTLNETAAVMANYRCGIPDDANDQVSSPLLAMPTSSQPVSFTATNVPRAIGGTTVDIVVSAVGNLGASSETLSLRIGSTDIGTVIGNTGSDCGQHARRTSIPASTFNAAIGSGGSVRFTLLASFASAGSCTYGEARVVLRYRALAPCTGDLDGDRVVSGADIGALLGAWGPCTGGCAADLNGDGAVNGADIGALLGNWGPCQAIAPLWATAVAAQPDPAVVTSATLRSAIAATGLAWRVRDNATNIEMLLVPPGTFSMGCSPSNWWPCEDWESPVRQVTLANAVYLGRHEVTQAQWAARMGSNPSWFQPPNTSTANTSRPVETVSWTAVQSFLAGTGLRLPTEAEWEFAYRAGTTTAFHSLPGFPNGTNDDAQAQNLAWYRANSWAPGTAIHGTKAVAQLPANGFGLHDMAGNVDEFVGDWFGTYPAGAATNPAGPATGTQRVFRGGSWRVESYGIRASSRSGVVPGGAQDFVGFRVARTP